VKRGIIEMSEITKAILKNEIIEDTISILFVLFVVFTVKFGIL